jgi:hypothetical protein
MPHISVIFEVDGIYVCQNGSLDLWQYLEDLKKYITLEKVEFKIIDYDE